MCGGGGGGGGMGGGVIEHARTMLRIFESFGWIVLHPKFVCLFV